MKLPPPLKKYFTKTKITKSIKALVGFPFYVYKIHSRLKNIERDFVEFHGSQKQQSIRHIENSYNDIVSSFHKNILDLQGKQLLYRQLGGVNEADFLHRAKFYCSQYNQDVFVDTLLKEKTDGFFIELGAAYAKEISNTYFFEEYRNWKGLLIEANPYFIQELKAVRKNSIIEQCAVSCEEGKLAFCPAPGLGGIPKYFHESHHARIGQDFAEIKVPAYKLETLLDKYQITKVDYLSLDTEGNELDVLQSIDYQKVVIKIIQVEISHSESFSAIYHFLKGKDYRLYGKIVYGFNPVAELDLKENPDGSIFYQSKDIRFAYFAGQYIEEGDFVFLHKSFVP